MSHHVDYYVIADVVEECNVSNFRANGQLDTKDGGTSLKYLLGENRLIWGGFF